MIKRYLKFSSVLVAFFVIKGCSANLGLVAAAEPAVVHEESQEYLDALERDESHSSGTIEFLRIRHFMVECERYYVGHCLLAKRQGSNEWTYFYDTIDGFDYHWGVDYEILVQVIDNESSLADTSNLHYKLLEVISEHMQDNNEAFHYISRKPNVRITQIAPAQYLLLDDKSIMCTDKSCGALRSAMDQNHSVLLSFQHNTSPIDPLILTAVTCSDASTSFTTSCL